MKHLVMCHIETQFRTKLRSTMLLLRLRVASISRPGILKSISIFNLL